MASLTTSQLANDCDGWKSSPAYTVDDLKFSPRVFDSVTRHLLCNPNLNSTHLFRADILFDSLGELKTPAQIEHEFEIQHPKQEKSLDEFNIFYLSKNPPKEFPGLAHHRTVIRELIPRKPQLDKPIDQVCHFYSGGAEADTPSHSEAEYGDTPSSTESRLFVQIPNASSQEEIPWYHPPLRALAFLYELEPARTPGSQTRNGRLSVHVLPFADQVVDPIPERLQRTLLSLISTYVRLARITPEPDSAGEILRVSSRYPKDTLVPQHMLQNTYTRLKEEYAADLIEKWVEKTETAKHVFEDIAIAAFLMELWRASYGIIPPKEQETWVPMRSCPGFVDLACGNGVLVYILLSEKYHGWGFDLRRRKTWSIFPKEVQPRLMEMICVPKPFQDVLDLKAMGVDPEKVHDGIFAKNTFFVSNHADELTPWTPLLAALACPEYPSPFLAIPCCSHALSGARHRYQLSKPKAGVNAVPTTLEQDEQPVSGDLKALKMAKIKAAAGDQNSTYATLTAYIERIAQALGYDVEQTLMRIPSTRNIGVIGRKMSPDGPCGIDRINDIVKEECAKSGGLENAAKIWLERALGLQKGPGRGKLKGGASH